MFEKKYKEDMTKSEQVPPKTNLCKLYPFQKPVSFGEGGWDGLFGGLEMCIGIGMDPNEDNSCLTRSENGTFVWSE